MAHKADTMATTFKDKKPPKVVSHIEVHPSTLAAADAVHTVHTLWLRASVEAVKNFEGPHEAVSLPSYVYKCSTRLRSRSYILYLILSYSSS